MQLTLNNEFFQEVPSRDSFKRDSLSHVFPMEHGVAAVTLEAPDVPLAIESDQRLTFPQLVSATGASTRVAVPAAFGTSAITDRRRGLANWDTNASVTQCLTCEQCTVSGDG